MSALLEHLRFELRSTLRHPAQLLLSYLFPIAFFLFIGAVMPRLNPAATATLVPAFSLFALLTGAILGLPPPLVDARRLGVARAFRVIGVPDVAALGVPALAQLLHGLLAAGLVSLVGPWLFSAQAPLHPGAFSLVLFLGAFVFTALGSLIGVLSTDSRSSVLWSQSLFLPSMLLGGLMLPVSALPPRLAPFSALLPTTHLLRLHEALAYGRASTTGWWIDALLLLVTGLIAYAAALVIYRREAPPHPLWRVLLLLAALAPLSAGALLPG